MPEEDFQTSTRKIKCTYGACEGDFGGGLVDTVMRPFHTGCVPHVLSEHRRLPWVLVILMFSWGVLAGWVSRGVFG